MAETNERIGDGPTPSQWSTLRRFLCRMFQRLGARAHDAEDLAQESLARVIGRPGGDSQPVSIGFAATIGRNLWRDRMRRYMRRHRLDVGEPASEPWDPKTVPDQLASDREEKVRLRDALETLDARHRDAIKLVILEEKSYAEAARILGVPPGTVKSRIHYGIRRLRVQLERPVLDPRSTKGDPPC